MCMHLWHELELHLLHVHALGCMCMHLCIHNVAKMFLSTAFWAHHTITMASMWDDMQSTEVSLMLVVATRIKWPTIMKTASTHNDTLQLPSLFTLVHVIWGAMDFSLSPNSMVVVSSLAGPV